MKTFEWRKETSWPDYLGDKYIKDVDRVPLDLVTLFKKDYSHVRAYHACRPINVESYLKNGIYLPSLEELNNDFIGNIGKHCNIELSNKEVSSARTSLFESSRRCIYVVLDDEFLIENAGHYAIYGSEYLISLAQSLWKSTRKVSKENLTQYGIPTVLVINLSLDKVEASDFEALVKEINNAIFHEEETEGVDFSFALTESIESGAIVDFYHPKEISDPLEIPRVYTYKQS